MSAQVAGNLDRHTLAAALQVTRRSPVEQIGRQLDPPDQFELRQLILHAGKAWAAGTAAQFQQDGRRVACGFALSIFNGALPVARFFGAQQGIQAFASRGRQPPIHAAMEAVFVGAQRTARDALHPVWFRRLDGEFAATSFQPLDHRLNVTANFSGNMITQPLRQHLGIGYRRFAEAETHADFAAQPLGSAAREEGFAIDGRGCVELFGERGYALYLDFGFVARETAAIAEEGQQDGKAQPVRPVFGHHQFAFGWRQYPLIFRTAAAVRHTATLLGALTRASRPASEFRSRWSASRRSCGTRPPWTCHLRARR